MTTNSIMTLLCLAIVAVVAVVAYMIYRNKKREREAERREQAYVPRDPFADHDSDVLRGDPRALKAGDIFDTHGETLTVRGTLRMSEGGVRWSEHLIDTGGGVKRWLSVEEDPDLELTLWTEVEGAPPPGPRTVEYDGKTYALDEEGRAQYTGEATTGLAPAGTVHYYDYEADDGSYLSYEDFKGSGNYESAVGLTIERNEITIYPPQTS
ncbi:MAG: DUF4178 domain-containing protein [Stackebrandtia sp.]